MLRLSCPTENIFLIVYTNIFFWIEYGYRRRFNCYDSLLDKLGGNVNLQKELVDFKSDFHLTDVWRKKHPKERQVTWFNFDLTIACRLDKFFVSKNVSENTTACSIFPCVLSDHDFVSLHFNLSSFRVRGLGVWKLNNSLLQDLSFQDAIRKSINDQRAFLTSRSGGIF